MYFFNQIHYFSIEYPGVLTRLSGPCSRLNSLLKLWKLPGIKPTTSTHSDHLGAIHLLCKGPEGGGVGKISTYSYSGGRGSNPFLRNIFQVYILYYKYKQIKIFQIYSTKHCRLTLNLHLSDQ